MISFNREKIRDKIYACWIGKNIGGTMGGPYEHCRELLDIKGFSTPKGEPLPNDDLDLQIVWLRALNDWGSQAINSKILSQYWTNYIGPHWNEYGVCKANMRAGILPPMSGTLYNEEWTHSNGAWIRTEIWACTHPGCPEKAVRLAFEDACVDHGFGEGTYAAIFVAAMESAAFVFNDLDVLIKIGLSKIPADCRVARSVNMVLDGYKKGMDWRDLRNAIVEDSKDLGWFQAPANIAYVILGLLYGEGDFKQSMIYAVNCGDDTDCTAATLGALLGIMHGMSIIPEDWKEHIGDQIKTISIVLGFGAFPQTCTELTDLVMQQIPMCAQQKHEYLEPWHEDIELIDGEDNFGSIDPESYCGDEFVRKMFNRSKYSFTMENAFAEALIEFDCEPVISKNGTIECKITVNQNHNFARQDHYDLYWYLPEGWSVEGRCHVYANEYFSNFTDHASTVITIRAGENVAPNNRIILEVRNPDHPVPILVPITIFA